MYRVDVLGPSQTNIQYADVLTWRYGGNKNGEYCICTVCVDHHYLGPKAR